MVFPCLAVRVRRLHDADCSGWWLLLALIPAFGILIVLAMLSLPGERYKNRFGLVPS